MRQLLIQAFLLCMLLALAGCGGSERGHAAGPLVFPTPTPTTTGPPGPPPLSIYLSSANFQGDAENFVAAVDAASGKPRWNYTASAQVANPVKLYQGLVFIGTADHTLYALDAGSGAVRWSYDIGGGAPLVEATDGGVVYVGFYQTSSGSSAPYALYALNASDGALKWRSQIGGIINTLAGGVIYLSSVDGLYALNASDGSVKWHTPLPQAYIGALQDGAAYVIGADQRVYALNASTGAVRWQFQAAYPPMLEQVADRTVYLLASPESQNGSGPYSILYALNASTGARQWQYPSGHDQENVAWIGAANGVAYLLTTMNESFQRPSLVLALAASTGAARWRYQLNSQAISIQSTKLSNGVVYLGINDGTLDALDASTGAMRWHAQAGNSPPFIELIDNGVIYASFFSGISFTAIDASTGAVLWHYQPDVQAEILQADNGLLYLGTFPYSGPGGANYLYALQIGNGTLFWRYNAGATPFFAVIG